MSEHDRCDKGDVVLVGPIDAPDLIDQVVLHFSVQDDVFSLVQSWPIEANATRHWKCRSSADCVIVATATITCSLIWGGQSGRRTVLKPFRA